MINILVILSILLLIFIYFYYNNYNTNTTNTIEDIQYIGSNNTHLIEKDLKYYLKNVSNSEIVFKTGKLLKKTNLYEFYIKNILNFTEYEKNIIQKYIEFININCSEYTSIVHTPWNFVKTHYKLEKGMPFTIGKCIFISNKFVDNLINSITNKNKFLDYVDTLIHEKIHIIQRYNQVKFNKLYKKHLNSINRPVKLTDKWKTQHLKNPDGLDINWIYLSNNDYYLPLLTFNKHGLKQKAILLKKYNNGFKTTDISLDLEDLNIFSEYPNNISTYHPNEISAYTLPKLILNTQKFHKNTVIRFKYILNLLKNNLKLI